MSLKAQLEAIIYAAETPITLEQMIGLVKETVVADGAADDAEIKSRVRSSLEELAGEYGSPSHGIEIRQVAGGYRMSTKPEQHEVVRAFAKSLKPPIRLSLPALETLAVIAYKQPVTVPEINEIRGVDSGGVIGTLLDRKLITTAGRKQVIGRPILYKTTKEFLMRFGLKDVNELPSMEEFEKLVAESFQEELIPAEASETTESVAVTEPQSLEDVPAEEKAGEDRNLVPPQRVEIIMPTERLQKIIAAAGVASRRTAEKLISSGAVQVNGQVVTELGSKADPETDHVRVNGKLLHGAQRHHYLLLNKPKGYVTTMSDPEKRPTVMDLIRGVKGRVYPVGRLDYASEGLLLLTNDGELAHRLMKAASHVPKTYVVKVAGTPKEDAINKLRAGVSIATDDGKRVKTGPALVRVVKEATNPWYEITLVEGRNRQIRRMFEAVGHHVEKIKRVRYGPLTLDVPPGKFRSLTLKEIERLKSASTTGAAGTKRSVS